MSTVPGSVVRSTTQKLSETPSVLDYGAARNGTTSATAAIQKALDKTVSGGTLLFPKGRYLIDYPGTGTECLLCPKPIQLVFERGAQLLVAAAVPGTVDILRCITPIGGPGYNYGIDGMNMVAVSGTPGRYGLNLDATLAPIFESTFANMRIDAFGSQSMAIIFPPFVGDGFFTSQFRSCYFGGGVLGSNIGDSVSFWHCTFYGDNIGLDISIVDGAHQFGIYQCNSTAAQCSVLIRRGDNIVIRDNNFEGVVTSAGTYQPAVITIAGTSANPCQNVLISGNCLSTFRINRAIQIDWGEECFIESNWTQQGLAPTVVGTDERIRITANALRTRVGRHIYLAPVPIFDAFQLLNQSATTTFDAWDSIGNGVDGNLPEYRVYDTRSPIFGQGAGLLLQCQNVATTRLTFAAIRAYVRSGVVGAEQGDLAVTTMRLGTPTEAGRFLAEGGLTTPQIKTLLETITAATAIGATDLRTLLTFIAPSLTGGGGPGSGLSIDYQLTSVSSVRLIGCLEPEGFQIWTAPSTGAGPIKHFAVDGFGGVYIFQGAIGAGATSTAMNISAPYGSGTSGQSIDFQINGLKAVRIICRAPGSIEFWTTANSITTAPAPMIMIDTVGIKIWNGTAWVALGSAPSGGAGGDLTGTYPNPTLAAVGTAGTYTSVTTDAKGRVTAGTNPAPGALTTASAAATSSLTLSGSMTDVAGATVSLVAGVWLVNAVFAFSTNQGGTAAGALNVGGTLQAGQAKAATQAVSGNEIAMAAQCWIVTVVGTQTVKLQASIGGVAAGTCLITDTTINCVKVG